MVVVAAATGCGGSTSGTDGAERPSSQQIESDAAATTTDSGPETGTGSWATNEELDWLEKFGVWNAKFSAGIAKLDAFASDAYNEESLELGDEAALTKFERLLQPLSECEKTFAEEVGDPPSERLGETADLMAKACQAYGRAAQGLFEGTRDNDARALVDAREATEDGAELVAQVNEALPPGEVQALPKLERATDESKIDPRYSNVATQIADEEIEVRCWSGGDWERLLPEERAFAGREFPSDILGITGYSSRRVNLSPIACAELDRFTYSDWRPREGDAQLLLAYSVVTLGHEVQHAVGVVEEATADCFGMQHAEEVARGLGADARYASDLAEAYWDDYENLQKLYRSPECRPGGELDLKDEGPGWP